MLNTLRNAALAGLATLAALCLLARPSAAQVTYITSNTTISSYYPNDTYVTGNPTVNLVTGGSVDGDFEANDTSTINVSGGTVYNTLYALGGSTVNVSGGTIHQYLFAFNGSLVNVSGGSFGRYLYANNVSTVNITGGTFQQFEGVNFLDSTSGPLTFVGSGLSYTLDPTGLTPITGGTDYTLTGLLQNGQSVNGDVIEVTNGAAMFNFSGGPAVPEPSAVSLLGLGTICLAGLLLRANKRRASA